EYYKADQFANAKELLLRNMNNSGTNKAVSDFYLGLISLHEGNQADALKYFNEGIQNNPDYAYNYVGLGIIDLKKGDKKAAESQFKMAESKEKKSPELQINIARAYYNADPVAYAKEIEKRINNARKFNMQDENIYIFEGDVKKDAKDFGGAAAKYEMATTYSPKATPAYVKYANLFTQVNPAYAIKMLNALLEQNPNSALGQRELANAYYNKGDYKEAAREYEKYVKNPNHFKQDEDRFAFLLFYGGDYQQGYDYSSALLKANPKNFTAQRYQFMNAAQIQDMRGQLLPMAEALVATHKADPANKFAPIDYILIASELNDAKRPQEAQALLEEAIAENPTNREFYKQLAMTFVEENKLSKAVEAYEGFLKNTENPGYNDFIQQATFAFYAGVENKDNPAEADKYYAISQEYADKAAEAFPGHYKPKKFAGDIARQKASSEAAAKVAAVPAYTEAFELLMKSENPKRYTGDAKEMYNYLGNAYLEKKDVAKAKEYFQNYTTFDPDNAAYATFVNGLK
ncbi:MAG: tetratricopeptide repeat protein, partial [Muribaculaceae bacterium]|nr:tetratricopeptide repeat protein [Muribaculaceae bacterium]